MISVSGSPSIIIRLTPPTARVRFSWNVRCLIYCPPRLLALRNRLPSMGPDGADRPAVHIPDPQSAERPQSVGHYDGH